MSRIIPFTHEEHGELVAIVDQKGQIWLDATKVCQSLGYARDAANVVKKLKESQKRLMEYNEYKDLSSPTHSVGLLASTFPRWFVNEAGAYRLIMGSPKEEANEFCDWIAEEILPSIRKTGAYFPTLPHGEGTPFVVSQIEKILLPILDNVHVSVRQAEETKKNLASIDAQMYGHYKSVEELGMKINDSFKRQARLEVKLQKVEAKRREAQKARVSDDEMALTANKIFDSLAVGVYPASELFKLSMLKKTEKRHFHIIATRESRKRTDVVKQRTSRGIEYIKLVK